MHIIRPTQHYGYSILNSARFDGSSGYLTWTPSSGGDRKTFSLSWWEKICSSANNMLFYAHQDANNFHYIYRVGSQIYSLARTGGVTKLEITWTPFYRDPSSWQHFFITVDATSDMKLYVNGSEVTARTVSTAIANEDLWFANNVQHTIGFNPIAVAQYNESYMAEIHFTNHGSLNTVSDFAEEDEYGAWVPKRYTGSYGSNGFYLDFYRSGSLGFDRINGNSFTVNGTITQSKDSPTDKQSRTVSNLDTLNPLFNNGTVSSLSNGNRTWTTATGSSGKRGTLAMSSGKFNLPFKIDLSGSSGGLPGPRFGLIGKSAPVGSYPAHIVGKAISIQVTDTTVYKYIDGGAGVVIGTGGGTTNDVFALEVDFDTDTVTLYKNGVLFASVVTGHLATDTHWFIEVGYSGAATYPIITYENNQADWSYSPSNPVFKALCTANLPTVTERLGQHFNTVLYTGDGVAIGSGGQSITGVGFQPDLVWIKGRSVATNHEFQDSLRGATKRLLVDTLDAESTIAESITSFDADGFTVGSNNTVNDSGATFVAWCARLPTDEVNSSGTIPVTWKYNATLGMAIGTYTGNGVAGATLGIPAEFGSAPFMQIVKNRSTGANNWSIWHEKLTDASYYLFFHTAAQAVNSTIWNSTAPTSSFVTLGTAGTVNENTGSHIIILFFETNLCKSVNYEGNSNADGALWYANGKPNFWLIKNADAIQAWNIHDRTRSPFNPINDYLVADQALAEQVDVAGTELDYISTGVKLRANWADHNQNTMIGVAFVEPLGLFERGQRR